MNEEIQAKWEAANQALNELADSINSAGMEDKILVNFSVTSEPEEPAHLTNHHIMALSVNLVESA